MKKFLPVLALVALVTTAVVAPAAAEEKKLVGPITKIQLNTPAAGKVTVTVKDKKDGSISTIIVSDEITLDKIKSKKMSEGDEVRAKFDSATGAAKSLKRTAGCD